MQASSQVEESEEGRQISQPRKYTSRLSGNIRKTLSVGSTWPGHKKKGLYQRLSTPRQAPRITFKKPWNRQQQQGTIGSFWKRGRRNTKVVATANRKSENKGSSWYKDTDQMTRTQTLVDELQAINHTKSIFDALGKKRTPNTFSEASLRTIKELGKNELHDPADPANLISITCGPRRALVLRNQTPRHHTTTPSPHHHTTSTTTTTTTITTPATTNHQPPTTNKQLWSWFVRWWCIQRHVHPSSFRPNPVCQKVLKVLVFWWREYMFKMCFVFRTLGSTRR